MTAELATTHLTQCKPSNLAVFIDEMTILLGSGGVFTDSATRTAYSYDAYIVDSQPDVVVFPKTSAHVVAIVRAALVHRVPYVGRGAGTGYAGGSVPLQGGVVISLQDMNRILEFNEDEGWIRAEAGVVTATLSEFVGKAGWRYPPDPSSLRVSTIGGNVSTNAGGPHCLGYGVTSNYVLELEVVTVTGSLLTVGAATAFQHGLDIRGLFVGAEGTFGIVTAVCLRLIRQPQTTQTYFAKFESIESAIQAMLDIFRRAIVPIALELVWSALLPTDAGFIASGETFMFIELEGCTADVTSAGRVIDSSVQSFGGVGETFGKASLMEKRLAVTVKRVQETRLHASVTRYFLFDAVVPRENMLPLMRVIQDICTKYKFPITNTFHAGDGNVHPALFFRTEDPDIEKRLSGAWRDLLVACNNLHGAVTGEHGIGIEKRNILEMYLDGSAFRVMKTLHSTIGSALCNPGKIFPVSSTPALPGPKRTLPHDSTDRLTISTTAGILEARHDVTLEEIDSSLRDTPYQLPYEPIGAARQEFLCDVVARGCPSVRELRYGPMRDLVLGGLIEAPSGNKLWLGGNIVKDVGGYDLRKLLFGSQGRIGQIDRLIMKIVPRQRCEEHVEISCASLADSLRLMRSAFFQLPCLSAIFLRSSLDGPAVDVWLEGEQVTVEQGRQTLATLVSNTSAATLTTIPRLLRHELCSATAMTALPGQPWNLEAPISELLQNQVPFLAFAGSRYLLTAQQLGGPCEAFADIGVKDIERSIIHAFAAV